MVESIKHRGPDESGFWEDSAASLGMARLSIIDVAGGHQPVFSSDGTIVAVCNGELYNHQQLAADLIASGVALASRSDVEVIPHLYEKHGDRFVELLRGMFAIALFDSRTGKLLLARDRVGKKPLHYFVEGGTLTFASETRALLAGGLEREPEVSSLDHVLAFGHVPLAGGAFRGERQVLPGHVLIFHQGEVNTFPYWSWRPHPTPTNPREAQEAALAVIDEAVRVRLVSERPLGSFLSGGIDSTVVTALMARHHSGPVKTFTVGFGDEAYNEAPQAREVARYLGTEHHEIQVDPDPVTVVERLAEAYSEPFADSSAVPTFLLSEFAAEHVVVALAGDGGDEAFGGYVRYRAASTLQRLNPLLSIGSLGRPVVYGMARQLNRPRWARLADALQPQPSLESRYLRIMSLIQRDLRERLWSGESSGGLSVSATDALFAETWRRCDSGSPVDHMRAFDMAFYLPGDLLTKVDVASMANSLEVRSPLLDTEVLAVAGSLPERLMIHGGTEKWLLRQIAYDLVPQALIDRPKKGFSIPRAAWLRGPLRDMTRDLLLDKTAQSRGWFRPSVVEELLDQHDNGHDRDMQLWPMLMIEVWARRWVDLAQA